MKHWNCDEWRSADPVRRVDWRWRRACELQQAKQYSPRQERDGWTDWALHYLRAKIRCANECQRGLLPHRFPEIHATWSLFQEGSDARTTLEARLLTRDSIAEIAKKTGIAERVVNAYEALFFNVGDRLDARDWVLSCAIGQCAFAAEKSERRRRFARHCAYFRGAHFLDLVLYVLGMAKCPGALAGMTEPEVKAATREVWLLEDRLSEQQTTEDALRILKVGSFSRFEIADAAGEILDGVLASAVRKMFENGALPMEVQPVTSAGEGEQREPGEAA